MGIWTLANRYGRLWRQSAIAAGKQERRIWFLASLPPPLNGQAIANIAMRDHLRDLGKVIECPLGADRAEKLAGCLLLWLLLAFRLRRDDAVYLSLPGQNGAWLLLPTLLVIRMRGASLVVHHHSYRLMIKGRRPLGRAISWAGGARMSHAFLSQRMRAAFLDLYGEGTAENCLLLSNAALTRAPAAVAPRVEKFPFTIGHLSVMAESKGVRYLLALIESLYSSGVDVRLLLAGPIADPRLEAHVRSVCARYPDRACWLGPVAGAAKAAFLDEIDCLVLPTSLVDEAEPLVLFEAYNAGADVLASARGCIPERIRGPDHLLSLIPEEDMARLQRLMALRLADRGASQRACRDHAARLRDGGEAALADMAQALFPAVEAPSIKTPAYSAPAPLFERARP